MPPRPRHNDPDLERLIREAERKGWRIEGGGNAHFKLFCPCHTHKKIISTTPGSRNHEKRTRRFLERHTCWLEEE